MPRSDTSCNVARNLARNYAVLAANRKVIQACFAYGYFIVGACSFNAFKHIHIDILISIYNIYTILRFNKQRYGYVLNSLPVKIDGGKILY